MTTAIQSPPSASYLHALAPSLPSEYRPKLDALGDPAKHLLDALLRFVLGAECPASADPQTRKEWSDKQLDARKTLDGLKGGASGIEEGRVDANNKRKNEEDETSSYSKKPRLGSDGKGQEDDDGPIIYALHNMSTTSPLRKRLTIAIHSHTLQFTHPFTSAVEASLPLSSFKRAFLLPTRSKPKPHWTVVILPSDRPKAKGKGKDEEKDEQQVIFGLEAQSSGIFKTSEGAFSATQERGTSTYGSIWSFLRRLQGVEVLEPSPTIFRSAIQTNLTNERQAASVEAYRGAKQGTLWFFERGLLWGESKPCEFWALEDLVGGKEGEEGVRVVSATGRTCSVHVVRRVSGDGEEEEEWEETQFGMIDGKERDAIVGWVRRFKSRFGVVGARGEGDGGDDSGGNGAGGSKDKRKGKGKASKEVVLPDSSAALNAELAEDQSDPEDEDFVIDSDDESGSGSGSEESSSEGGSEEEEEAEESDRGQGGASVDEDQESEEELDEARHPLLRPGAMPARISKAAMDAVVGMVEDDFLGGGAESEEEEDELED